MVTTGEGSLVAAMTVLVESVNSENGENGGIAKENEKRHRKLAHAAARMAKRKAAETVSKNGSKRRRGRKNRTAKAAAKRRLVKNSGEKRCGKTLAAKAT